MAAPIHLEVLADLFNKIGQQQTCANRVRPTNALGFAI